MQRICLCCYALHVWPPIFLGCADYERHLESSKQRQEPLKRRQQQAIPDRQAAPRSRCAHPLRMPRRAQAGAQAATIPRCCLPAQMCSPGSLLLSWTGRPCAELWRSWPHTLHARPLSALSGLLQAARKSQDAHYRPLPASTARRTARGLHQINRVMWSPSRDCRAQVKAAYTPTLEGGHELSCRS